MMSVSKSQSSRYVRMVLAVAVLFGLGLSFAHLQGVSTAEKRVGIGVLGSGIQPEDADSSTVGGCYSDSSDPEALMAEMLGRTMEDTEGFASPGSDFPSDHADGQGGAAGSGTGSQPPGAAAPSEGDSSGDGTADQPASGDEDGSEDDAVDCPRPKGSTSHPVPRTPEGQ